MLSQFGGIGKAFSCIRSFGATGVETVMRKWGSEERRRKQGYDGGVCSTSICARSCRISVWRSSCRFSSSF